ncbi:MAG: hypothetical protein AB7P23_07805 [Amphiplicatus sp.]
MARTLSIIEDVPASRPYNFQVLCDGGPPPEVSWQRIEAWIAYRWGEREATFIVEGPGDWAPPLKPFVTNTVELWNDDDWSPAVLRPTPLGGYVLEGCGPFRFVGVLGVDEEPPAAVKQAHFLLGEYLDAAARMPPRERMVKSIEVTRPTLMHEPPDGGEPPLFGKEKEISIDNHRPEWIARALIYSGAADLLRPWRNLGAA